LDVCIWSASNPEFKNNSAHIDPFIFTTLLVCFCIMPMDYSHAEQSPAC
jgi:hypothetical protein